MRTNGVNEKYITGTASDFEKFQQWAATVPYTLRNPLYHWTHLELQRYFDVYEKHLSKFIGKSPRILEIGILGGGSIEMWLKYFGEGTSVVGIDINPECRNYQYDFPVEIVIGNQGDKEFWENFLQNKESFDIIIDDTTHNLEDAVRIIKNSLAYLNPGGFLIIEDIFKRNIENDYIIPLHTILENFRNYYFLELDCKKRNSGYWNNDKLLVLIKSGGETQSVPNKLTIINTLTNKKRTSDSKIKDKDVIDISAYILFYQKKRVDKSLVEDLTVKSVVDSSDITDSWDIS